jgi:hypothetical protein
MHRRKWLEGGMFLVILAGAIVLYLEMSQLAGIMLMGVGIVIMTGAILIQSPKLTPYLRHPRLSWKLKQYPVIRESQLQKITSMPESTIHRALYRLSKAWNLSPLVILVDNEYIFLNKSIVKHILQLIKTAHQTDRMDLSAVIKKIRKKLKLQTRAEAATIIHHLSRYLSEP